MLCRRTNVLVIPNAPFEVVIVSVLIFIQNSDVVLINLLVNVMIELMLV